MSKVDYSEVYDYLDYLKNHGRRPRTILNAKYRLCHMLDILDEAGRPTKLEEITLEDVS